MRPKILAIDYGRVRHGLAVSDALGISGHPLPALQRRSAEADLAHLRKVVEEHDVAELVVGLPINMDGSEGGMAKEVRAWAGPLAEALGLPLLLEDERLSTDEAESMLQSAGLRPSDRKRYRDSVAAAVILRTVLERDGPPPA